MRRQIGFTLVEMLAVLAIVALLAGMIYVVAGAAKARARRVDCLANLRSLSESMTLYHQDQGVWPGAQDIRSWQEDGWLRGCRVHPGSYADHWNEEISGLRWLPGEEPPPPAGGFRLPPDEDEEEEEEIAPSGPGEIPATWCQHGGWVATLWLDGRVTSAREGADDG